MNLIGCAPVCSNQIYIFQPGTHANPAVGKQNDFMIAARLAMNVDGVTRIQLRPRHGTEIGISLARPGLKGGGGRTGNICGEQA